MSLLKNDLLTRVILDLAIFALVIMLPWKFSIIIVFLATAMLPYFFEGVIFFVFLLSFLGILNSVWAVVFVFALIAVIWLRAIVISKYIKPSL